MGASLTRRLICLAMLLFTASLVTACSPVYTIARDLIESRQQQQPGNFPTPPRVPNVEPYLNARYRPELAEILPHTPIGFAKCSGAPDLGGIELVRCSITAGTTTLPILAQYDPADTHVNSALAISTLSRSPLEDDLALRIKAEYGVSTRVTCAGPKVRFSIPDSSISCKLSTTTSIGKTVRAFIIDSADWISLEAQPLPPDESDLRAAYDGGNGRHIPGAIVERIIMDRSRTWVASGSSWPLKSVKCPPLMNLSGERHSYCVLESAGGPIPERVEFVHDRLAFKMAGAYVGMHQIRKIARDVARLRRGKTPQVSIDCGNRYFVFVPPEGYHWCEISAPPGYPKRVVITTMDAEGHYDLFFSNFSQSAFAH